MVGSRGLGPLRRLLLGSVKNYASALFAKLGMKRRTQAAAYAARVFEEHSEREIRSAEPPSSYPPGADLA